MGKWWLLVSTLVTSCQVAKSTNTQSALCLGAGYLGDEHLAGGQLLVVGLRLAAGVWQAALQLLAALHQGLDLRLHLADIQAGHGELLLQDAARLGHLSTEPPMGEVSGDSGTRGTPPDVISPTKRDWITALAHGWCGDVSFSHASPHGCASC